MKNDTNTCKNALPLDTIIPQNIEIDTLTTPLMQKIKLLDAKDKALVSEYIDALLI